MRIVIEAKGTKVEVEQKTLDETRRLKKDRPGDGQFIAAARDQIRRQIAAAGDDDLVTVKADLLVEVAVAPAPKVTSETPESPKKK